LISEIVYNVVMDVLWLLFYAVFLSAIVSTLIAFNVLDTRNRFVWSLADFLARVTEPLIRPIRRRLPSFSGIDFSPWVVLVLIRAVAMPIVVYLYLGIHSGDWGPLL
jgi:YggT family protein